MSDYLYNAPVSTGKCDGIIPLRQVFLGDEICCANATCWTAALKPVTEKLRAMLGTRAIIYTNECANREISEVPPPLEYTIQ